ncbi:MAG: diguanylate cyclase [Ectothiorhodospiraceae bacterium]|nr:diguanylate cyclase [Ectothiorhodospiraceae bacterium]
MPIVLLLCACIAPVRAENPPPPDPSAGILSAEEEDYLRDLGTVRMCVDPDWAPYEYVGDDDAYEGIAADLVRLIAERAGVRLERLPTRDWKESLAASQAGDCHILAFLNRTPEREGWLIFTEPYFTDPNVFITREEHDFIADPSRLSDETIVFPAGTSLEERVRNTYPNLEVVVVDTEAEALRRVIEREADMTLRSLTMAAYTIRHEGLFNLKIAGQLPGFENHFRIGVAKEHPMLRDVLNRGVASITPRDVQHAINEHISIEVRSGFDYGLLLRIVAVFGLLLAIGLYWNQHLRRLNRKLAGREAELLELSEMLKQDIQAREATERRLQDSERRYRYIAENAADVIWILDPEDFGFRYVSPSVERLLGHTPDEIMTQPLERILAPETRAMFERAIPGLIARFAAGERPTQTFEVELTCKDGRRVWTETSSHVSRDDSSGRSMIYGVSRDITERRAKDERIRHMAQHDGLTNLPNRALFSDRLQQAIDLARREHARLALMFVDLDFFKPVNDTYGHGVGDLTLKEVARRLKESVRASDTVGRIGGDEFVVLVRNLDTPAHAVDVAEKIRTEMERTIIVAGHSIRIAASIGFALFPDHGEDQTTLFLHADEALYVAKARGRNRACGYQPQDEEP